MRTLMAGVVALLLATPVSAFAQRPDTVFFEDLTFDEIRESIQGGASNVIVAVGGAEDGGRQLVLGRRSDVITYAADRIARELGGTLVAPVIAYAPGGIIPLPDDQGFSELIEAAATSVKGSGFTNIFLVGESAGSQASLKAVAEKLDAAWSGDGVRVVHVSDYYAKSREDQDRYVAGPLRLGLTDAGQRASFVETSEVLAVNGQLARLGDVGLSGTPPAPQYGNALLAIKVSNAVAQIRSSLGQRVAPAAAPTPAGPRVAPTPDPQSASASRLFLEDLTIEEIRAAVSGGSTVVIIPTGGTEKNGFHMAVGKHNFHARAGAALMAEKLGNALVAPVLQYVPEGQATAASPGVLSCARECFEHVVASIARGVKALGFTDILLVGDNGGNQTPLGNVASLLNREWDGSNVSAFALTDFYEKSHEYQDAWFLGQFGWDASVVGSHAGIKDTSQMLYVKPQDVRKNRIADSFNDKRESGISGDPTKATAEFGRVAIEFKANGALAQYRALKAQAQGGTGGGRSGGRGNR